MADRWLSATGFAGWALFGAGIVMKNGLADGLIFLGISACGIWLWRFLLLCMKEEKERRGG